MKISLISFFFLFTAAINGQDLFHKVDTTTTPQPNLVFKLSYDKNGFFLKRWALSGAEPSTTESVHPELGGAMEVAFEYPFSNQVSVQAGVAISVRNFQHIIDGFRFQTDIINGTVSHIDAGAQIINIEFPVLIEYYFRNKSRHTFFIGLGGSVNKITDVDGSGILFLGHDGSTDILDEVVYPFKKINFYGIGTVGYQYKLNNRLSLLLQPHFKIGLLKEDFYLRKSKARPYIWGISLGISSKLKGGGSEEEEEDYF